jgi:hypothetical protein
MKLSAVGEDGIFLMASSSQIERHRRRRLETLGALGEGLPRTVILAGHFSWFGTCVLSTEILTCTAFCGDMLRQL